MNVRCNNSILSGGMFAYTAAVLTLDKTLEHVLGMIGPASRGVKMDTNVAATFISHDYFGFMCSGALWWIFTQIEETM